MTSTTTNTTRATSTSKPPVNCDLVKYIKERNPRLGIAKIQHLLELQAQYADSLKHKDLVAADLALPLWDCTLLGSFSWGISYAPSSLWEALEYGKHNVYSLRSIIGNHLI